MTDLHTVVSTLRFLAGGGWVESRSDQEWFIEVADDIERGNLEGTCPLCQEVECDEGCPVSPHRS